MKNFFEKRTEKIFDLKNLSRDALLYRVMPHFFLEIVRKYFRVEVEGLEHIPRTGPALICPNHSGFSGFDAVLLAHEIFRDTKRIPRVLTHHLWFVTPLTALPAHKLGFIEATTKNGYSLLKKNNLVMLFPEGEYGNFKPSQKAYKLREFKRGFTRLSLMTRAPVIPTLILGAEETHINLRELKFPKYLFGTVLPLPLNIIPLPAKWKIIFMEPIYFPFKADAYHDQELVYELTQDVQEKMQRRLNEELKQREYIYFKKLF